MTGGQSNAPMLTSVSLAISPSIYKSVK